jgi:hypothetical protein
MVWKLDQSGQLFDMKNAPFQENLVPANTQNPAALAARQRLGTVLTQLNPANGKQGRNYGTHIGNLKTNAIRSTRPWGKFDTQNANSPSQ